MERSVFFPEVMQGKSPEESDKKEKNLVVNLQAQLQCAGIYHENST